MSHQQRNRILRQHIKTDQLLGVDFAPVSILPTPSPSQTIQHAPSAPTPVPQSQSPVTTTNPSNQTSNLFAPSPPTTQPQQLDRSKKISLLSRIDQEEVRACTRCDLCHSRTQTVFGEGDPDASLMFIGEGPGETEDRLGRPFVGRAGELLDKQIAAMGLRREQVYIANVVKCRPPNNRTPTPIETQTCWQYLRRQIAIISPAVIVTLGGPATKTLLQTQTGITALRGAWQKIQSPSPDQPDIPVMPTFHPAYLLRAYTPDNRKKVWSDLQAVMAFLAQINR